MKIGIYGYGNLARGVENAITKNPDMELAAVFTRRDPSSLKLATAGVPAVSVAEIDAWQDKLDVLILCGGSATDLPTMTPDLASRFHVIDSYDNHSSIPTHYANVDAAARAGGKVALISCGWDPGMFSLNRLYANAVLPQGSDYTFWGIPGPQRCHPPHRRGSGRTPVHHPRGRGHGPCPCRRKPHPDHP